MQKFVLLLAALILLFCSSVAAQTAYFPTGVIDDFLSDYYSHMLQLFQEPSLLDSSKTEGQTSYRFLWLRTFDPPIVVRIDVSNESTATISAKVGGGEAGFPYTFERIRQSTHRTLSPTETKEFLSRIDSLAIWGLSPTVKTEQPGTDGAFWVIEAVRGEKYLVATRWGPTQKSPPQEKAVRELGLLMTLNLARLKIPSGKIY